MRNLFTYGTLMCEAIMHAVSGHNLPSIHATLNGYSRRAVRGEAYPAIFPDSTGNVCGVLYLGVPDSAWLRLDEYEGEMYFRERVSVVRGDATILAAETYVLKPHVIMHLETVDWDYNNFLRYHKQCYLKEIKLVNNNKGR